MADKDKQGTRQPGESDDVEGRPVDREREQDGVSEFEAWREANERAAEEKRRAQAERDNARFVAERFGGRGSKETNRHLAGAAAHHDADEVHPGEFWAIASPRGRL